MAKRRNRRARGSATKLPQAAQLISFSESEEAFFRVGDSAAFEYEDPEPRPSLWRRLFS
jgi:hypothetical protein